MQLFLDTACIKELEEARASELIDGVTTNPSSMAKQPGSFEKICRDILGLGMGPVSIEVTYGETLEMVNQGKRFDSWGEDVIVKVPATFQGIEACRILQEEGIAVNVTLCFSIAQAWMAAKAGATYVSPFVGRLEDAGECGIKLITDMRDLYDVQDYDTQILAASMRTVNHVQEVALAGADVVTIAYPIFQELCHHPLTEKGLEKFYADWNASPHGRTEKEKFS